MREPENPIIYFDGICYLCHTAVRFVLNHDKKNQFRFIAFQSEEGSKLAAFSKGVPDSVILELKGKTYFESDAVLEILNLLGGFWRLFYVFKWIPRCFRNGVYRFVAKNRYRWFGKKEGCRLPL